MRMRMREMNKYLSSGCSCTKDGRPFKSFPNGKVHK